MAKTIADITTVENKNLKCKLIVAFFLYLATMYAYLGVFIIKEDAADHIQGFVFLNPIFIIATDIVILSLREQTVKVRKSNDQKSFIYSSIFKSIILLFSRVLLCYNK